MADFKVSKRYKGKNPKPKEVLEQEKAERMKKAQPETPAPTQPDSKEPQAIDFIEAVTADLSGQEAICTAHALECLCRWKKKNGLKDLMSARWYINRLINHLKEQNN